MSFYMGAVTPSDLTRVLPVAVSEIVYKEDGSYNGWHRTIHHGTVGCMHEACSRSYWSYRNGVYTDRFSVTPATHVWVRLNAYGETGAIALCRKHNGTLKGLRTREQAKRYRDWGDFMPTSADPSVLLDAEALRVLIEDQVAAVEAEKEQEKRKREEYILTTAPEVLLAELKDIEERKPLSWDVEANMRENEFGVRKVKVGSTYLTYGEARWLGSELLRLAERARRDNLRAYEAAVRAAVEAGIPSPAERAGVTS